MFFFLVAPFAFYPAAHRIRVLESSFYLAACNARVKRVVAVPPSTLKFFDAKNEATRAPSAGKSLASSSLGCRSFPNQGLGLFLSLSVSVSPYI